MIADTVSSYHALIDAIKSNKGVVMSSTFFDAGTKIYYGNEVYVVGMASTASSPKRVLKLIARLFDGTNLTDADLDIIYNAWSMRGGRKPLSKDEVSVLVFAGALNGK